jgi:hypothetical protein
LKRHTAALLQGAHLRDLSLDRTDFELILHESDRDHARIHRSRAWQERGLPSSVEAVGPRR